MRHRARTATRSPWKTLYTIGLEQQSLTHLLQQLGLHGVQTVVDVRRHANSPHLPEEMREVTMRAQFDQLKIGYHRGGRHLGEITFLDPSQHHPGLSTTLLRAYADFMTTDIFAGGVRNLLLQARKGTLALLGEAVDYRQCHRGLIADYLTIRGHQLLHIGADGAVESHVLHPALRRESSQPIYDLTRHMLH